MFQTVSRYVVVAVVVLALTACTAVSPAPTSGDAQAPAAGDAAVTVAVVTPYMANATTKYAIEQFETYGQEKGWNVTVTDTNADFNQLVSRIEDAVTQQVDAIVLGMGDPAQMTMGLESAQDAGIPVFGLDAGNGPGVVLNITSDNGQLGKETAHFLAEAIGGTGNVVMFTHDPHPGVRARAEAAAAEFANYPDIVIIDKRHIEVPGPVDFARSVTQDLLTANPNDGDMAGIWAGWDEPALGATQAIEAADRTGIVVVGIDGTDFARAEIAKGGPFQASIAQDFDGMAQQLADVVQAYLAGEAPTTDTLQIPGVMVTPENAE